jgi:uncharacterized protein DUF4403
MRRGAPSNDRLRPFVFGMLFLGCAAVSGASPKASKPDPLPNRELPLPEASFLLLPVRIPVQAAIRSLEAKLPGRLGREEFQPYKEGVEIRFRIERDSLQLVPDPVGLEIRDRLHYWLEARGQAFGTARCATPKEPFAIDIGWKVRFGLQDDWRLDSRTSAYGANFNLRCKPVPPAINFTGFLNETIERGLVQPFPTLVDSTLQARNDIRHAAEAAWAALQAPVDLKNNTWLQWNLEGVRAEPFTVSGPEFGARLGFLVRPQVVEGKQPAPTSASLPEAKVRLVGERLEVAMDFQVPLDVLNERLRQHFVVKHDELQPRLAAIRARGAGDRVTIEAELPAPSGGRVDLVGKLQFTPEKFELGVVDLEFPPETRSRLGVSRLHELESVRTEIQSQLVIGFEKRIPPALAQLGHGLNHQLAPQVSIRGGAMQLRTLAPFATESTLGVRLAAMGQATLSVE